MIEFLLRSLIFGPLICIMQAQKSGTYSQTVTALGMECTECRGLQSCELDYMAKSRQTFAAPRYKDKRKQVQYSAFCVSVTTYQ